MFILAILTSGIFLNDCVGMHTVERCGEGVPFLVRLVARVLRNVVKAPSPVGDPQTETDVYSLLTLKWPLVQLLS